MLFGASWRLTAWLAGLLANKGVLSRSVPAGSPAGQHRRQHRQKKIPDFQTIQNPVIWTVRFQFWSSGAPSPFSYARTHVVCSYVVVVFSP